MKVKTYARQKRTVKKVKTYVRQKRIFEIVTRCAHCNKRIDRCPVCGKKFAKYRSIICEGRNNNTHYCEKCLEV